MDAIANAHLQTEPSQGFVYFYHVSGPLTLKKSNSNALLGVDRCKTPLRRWRSAFRSSKYNITCIIRRSEPVSL